MSRCHLSWFFAALSVTLALTPTPAAAATGQAQFMVSVNVIKACRVDMQSANIAPTGGQNAAGTQDAVALSCSRNTGYAVSFGSNGKPSGNAKPPSVTGVGNGYTQVIPVYNQMTAESNAAGAAAKTIVMTIDY
jgi:hypothetical protein